MRPLNQKNSSLMRIKPPDFMGMYTYKIHYHDIYTYFFLPFCLILQRASIHAKNTCLLRASSSRWRLSLSPKVTKLPVTLLSGLRIMDARKLPASTKPILCTYTCSKHCICSRHNKCSLSNTHFSVNLPYNIGIIDESVLIAIRR